MKFYLINRYFYPDESATSLLLTDLAEDLAGKLHEVHVFTSRQLYNAPKAKLPKFEIWQGIHIHRIHSTTWGRNTFWGRLLDIITYRRALYDTIKYNFSTPDAWFVMTDPPLILEQVVKLQNRLGGKIVHHVDDVYPDLAMALKAIPANGIVGKWLNHRAQKSLMACNTVLALGDCMADVLKKKDVPQDIIQVTPPWADEKRLYPLPHNENYFRKELGFSEQDFIVMYSGNMGKGHRFETILETVKNFFHKKQIHFVFIGDGAKKKEIELFCSKHKLTNCHLLPYQPREKLRESLSASDVHLISLDSRVQGFIVPSKLAGILAVGRPVIFVGDTQNSVAQAILKGKCGNVVPDGAVNHLSDTLLKLYQHPDMLRLLGENAVCLFKKEYSRAAVVPRIISYLEN